MTKKLLIIAGLSLGLSTSLFAISNTKVDLQMKQYENIDSVKRIDEILSSVKDEGKIKNLKVKSQKWEEVNELLDFLINKKNYNDAYVLFKHIDFDNNLQEYKSYLRFFQIINKMYSNVTDFENINEIKSNNLLNHIFNYFFYSVETEKINDATIVSKLEEGLFKLDKAFFSFNEVQKVRYKLKLLKGEYVQALAIINTLEGDLSAEDKNYKRNIQSILTYFQENFFVNQLQMTHQEFKDFNIKYRSK